MPIRPRFFRRWAADGGTMTKRMLIMLAVTALVFGGVFGYKSFGAMMAKKYMGSFKDKPIAVSAMKSGYQTWQPQLKAVGSTRAISGVFVTSEVAGIVQSIHFKPGDIVKKGSLLVQLNADSDIALLHSLEIQARQAATVWERDKKQFKAQAISREALDAATSDAKSKLAQALQQKELVAKKSISAPFDGKLGINDINPGQFINPGTPIVSLQSLDNLYLDFYLPQQRVAEIAVGQTVVYTVNAYPQDVSSGTITCIDPNVDPATRNIRIEATVKNTRHLLLPGMYATVELQVGKPEQLLTLPQTAVTYNPYGDVVYLIENGRAKQALVVTGTTRGDQVAIVSGIKEGDTVVTAGQLKLRNGSPVAINNTIQPAFDAAPKAEDE